MMKPIVIFVAPMMMAAGCASIEPPAGREGASETAPGVVRESFLVGMLSRFGLRWAGTNCDVR